MKKYIMLLIFISMAIINTEASVIEEWNKTFGGQEFGGPDSRAEFSQQTSEGGYILVGSIDSYSYDPDYNVLLVKTDNNGNKQWNRIFGISINDFATYVQETSDRGYIIAANTYSSLQDNDAWIIKTDINGNEQWNKTFGGTYQDIIINIGKTIDREYIATGYTRSYNGDADAWVIKINDNGTEKWNKTFGGVSDDAFYSIQQTLDGGYIVSGETSSYGKGSADGWVVKLDTIGNEQWNKTFGKIYSDRFFSSQQTSEGEYILAGTMCEDGDNCLGYLVKIDSSGNEEWNKTFGKTGYNEIYSVQQTDDNGYIIAGMKDPYGNNGKSIGFIAKTDKNGNEIWNKTFGENLDSVIKSARKTFNGGYILAGRTFIYNNNNGYNERAWLIKLSNENIGPVHNINKGINYTTIQAAIDDANIGDEIRVDSGTYHENVDINKRLILKGIDTGNGRPIIDVHQINGYGTVSITVNNGIIFDGFKVKATNELPGIVAMGIYVNSNDNIIRNNTIYGQGIYGVHILGSYNNILTNNTVNPDRGWGIYLEGGFNNSLVNNNITSGSEGVRILNSYGNTLTNNKIDYNNNGIYVWSRLENLYSSSYNRFVNNNITSNGQGIILTFSNHNLLKDNNIRRNGYYGIVLDYSDNNTIDNNSLKSNDYGVRLYSSNNDTIINNDITNDAIGIYFANNSYVWNGMPRYLYHDNDRNKVYNNIFNNTNNIKYDQTNMTHNIWNTTRMSGRNIVGGPYIGGNFWTNPSNNGFSNICNADFDRICDTKYKLNDNNTDYLPLAKKDNKPPASISNLKNLSYINYINWTWTDPSTSDFSKVMVYINGVFKTNVTKGTKYYKAINLVQDTLYKISTHTVDMSGNINLIWINQTTRTRKDNIPPASITNLRNITYKRSYINWTWTDPSTSDFSKVMVYINGLFKNNVTKGKRYYNSTGLYPNTYYRISTHTVDIYGNINKTWVNRTAKTAS